MQQREGKIPVETDGARACHQSQSASRSTDKNNSGNRLIRGFTSWVVNRIKQTSDPLSVK